MADHCARRAAALVVALLLPGLLGCAPRAGRADVTLPPDHLLAPVLADASERGGIAAEQLVVVSSSPRTWRDGSLGCPEPGQHYTQALVPGWWLVLKAGDRELDYRMTERAGAFIVCETGRARDEGLPHGLRDAR
ncbi:MAG: hypothetical protein ACNA8J_01665 [Gammaproteobacteria bacterium]